MRLNFVHCCRLLFRKAFGFSIAETHFCQIEIIEDYRNHIKYSHHCWNKCKSLVFDLLSMNLYHSIIFMTYRLGLLLLKPNHLGLMRITKNSIYSVWFDKKRTNSQRTEPSEFICSNAQFHQIFMLNINIQVNKYNITNCWAHFVSLLLLFLAWYFLWFGYQLTPSKY